MLLMSKVNNKTTLYTTFTQHLTISTSQDILPYLILQAFLYREVGGAAAAVKAKDRLTEQKRAYSITQ